MRITELLLKLKAKCLRASLTRLKTNTQKCIVSKVVMKVYNICMQTRSTNALTVVQVCVASFYFYSFKCVHLKTFVNTFETNSSPQPNLLWWSELNGTSEWSRVATAPEKHQIDCTWWAVRLRSTSWKQSVVHTPRIPPDWSTQSWRWACWPEPLLHSTPRSLCLWGSSRLQPILRLQAPGL